MRLAPSFALFALALAAPSRIDAADRAKSAHASPAWCAPETEALAGDVCHVDFNEKGRRTLVVFLHGVVPHASTWQWTQQRAIVREAKLFHFAAIMPQAPAVGPHGAAGYAWPAGGSDEAQERALLQQWTRARRELEARAGKPFDEVFVLGFSSGAYFATSLATRGELRADGVVVLAGGTTPKTLGDVQHRAPFFIGVSSDDHATAPGARALAQWLRARDWPVRVDEEPIGHQVYDVHVAHALAYLRKRVDEDGRARR